MHDHGVNFFRTRIVTLTVHKHFSVLFIFLWIANVDENWKLTLKKEFHHILRAFETVHPSKNCLWCKNGYVREKITSFVPINFFQSSFWLFTTFWYLISNGFISSFFQKEGLKKFLIKIRVSWREIRNRWNHILTPEQPHIFL